MTAEICVFSQRRNIVSDGACDVLRQTFQEPGTRSSELSVSNSYATGGLQVGWKMSAILCSHRSQTAELTT